MTASLQNEKNNIANLEKKARDIQSKIDMMAVVEQVNLFLLHFSLIPPLKKKESIGESPLFTFRTN